MVKTSSLSKRVTYPHRFFLWLATAMDYRTLEKQNGPVDACTAVKANSQSNGNGQILTPGLKNP